MFETYVYSVGQGFRTAATLLRIPHSLERRISTFRATCSYDQVFENPDKAGAMGVAAENLHIASGVAAHNAAEAIANGTARKMRWPSCQHESLNGGTWVRTMRFLYRVSARERAPREIGPLHRLAYSIWNKAPPFDATQVGYQDVVVQHDLRLKEIAEAAVRPRIVPDQRGCGS
jgi:hypothetical protein